jgi:hypothetical protein
MARKTYARLENEIAAALSPGTKERKSRDRAPSVAYRLHLTPSEMQAVEYARGRYQWPDMLAMHASENGAIAFGEYEMSQWCDDVDSDAGGNHAPFPMASGGLATKLQNFYDQRI